MSDSSKGEPCKILIPLSPSLPHGEGFGDLHQRVRRRKGRHLQARCRQDIPQGQVQPWEGRNLADLGPSCNFTNQVAEGLMPSPRVGARMFSSNSYVTISQPNLRTSTSAWFSVMEKPSQTLPCRRALGGHHHHCPWKNSLSQPFAKWCLKATGQAYFLKSPTLLYL